MSEAFGREQIDRVITYLGTHRRFLFDKYGFEVLHTSTGGRYNTEPIVGLSNRKLHFLFHDADHPIPDVSCAGIPFVGVVDESTKEARIHSKYWIPSIMLFLFLDGVSPPSPWSREQWQTIRQTTWQKIEMRLPELERLFDSVETMQQWMPAYLRFLTARGGYIDASQREWLNEDSSVPE